MANPLSKGWKYLKASLDQKIDENADPKVQIQQAVEAVKAQHQAISEQAARVIGNQKQLEMKLDRLRKDQERLQQQARDALRAADNAESPEKAQQFSNTAEVLATQLVSVERQVEETAALHSQAKTAAEQARQQQAESEAKLHEQLSQINELRAQADQAAMQETATQAMDTMGTFKPDDSVPTLDAVREKIERRYADALGAQELTQSSVGGHMAEIQSAGTDMKAAARLAELRAELDAGKSDEPAAQLERGQGEDAQGPGGSEGTGAVGETTPKQGASDTPSPKNLSEDQATKSAADAAEQADYTEAQPSPEAQGATDKPAAASATEVEAEVEGEENPAAEAEEKPGH